MDNYYTQGPQNMKFQEYTSVIELMLITGSLGLFSDISNIIVDITSSTSRT